MIYLSVISRSKLVMSWLVGSSPQNLKFINHEIPLNLHSMVEIFCKTFELIWRDFLGLLRLFFCFLVLLTLVELNYVFLREKDTTLEVEWELCRCFDLNLYSVKHSEDQISINIVGSFDWTWLLIIFIQIGANFKVCELFMFRFFRVASNIVYLVSWGILTLIVIIFLGGYGQLEAILKEECWFEAWIIFYPYLQVSVELLKENV